MAPPLFDVLLQLRKVVPVMDGLAVRYDWSERTEPVAVVVMFSKRLWETVREEQEL